MRYTSLDLDALFGDSSSVNEDFPRCASREVSGWFDDEDRAGMVDSWFVSGSISAESASHFALATVSADVDALVETRQVDGCSRIATDEPAERDVAMAEDAQQF